MSGSSFKIARLQVMVTFLAQSRRCRVTRCSMRRSCRSNERRRYLNADFFLFFDDLDVLDACPMAPQQTFTVYRFGSSHFEAKSVRSCGYLQCHLAKTPLLCVRLIECPVCVILNYFTDKSEDAFGASYRKFLTPPRKT